MRDWILEWLPNLFTIAAIGSIAIYVVIAAVRSARQRRVQREKKEKLAARLPGHFVFAKIIDPISPMLRGKKYEEPLDEALQARNLGSVTGGGTQMGTDNSVAWVGLDLELSNLEEALEFTRHCLWELGAPLGSVLEYRIGDQQLSVPL